MHNQGLSHFWKGILKQLESFLLSTKVIVGNGEDTSFQRGYRYTEISFANLSPELLNLTFDPDVSVHDYRLLRFKRNLTGALVDKVQEIQLLINNVQCNGGGDRRT